MSGPDGEVVVDPDIGSDVYGGALIVSMTLKMCAVLAMVGVVGAVAAWLHDDVTPAAAAAAAASSLLAALVLGALGYGLEVAVGIFSELWLARNEPEDEVAA